MIVDDHNKDFFLNLYKDIVRTDDGYCLLPTYEKDGDVRIKPVAGHTVSRERLNDCVRCIYCDVVNNCLMRSSLENLPENCCIPYWWNACCDAYSPVFPLNVIKSEAEMIDFVEKVQNFFGSPEDYENYFGFERKWNEDTGEILESTREYYDRGGKFENIPGKYPCVIYFGVVDFDGKRDRDEKLDWIYIGGP